jgi:hypothetical protein
MKEIILVGLVMLGMQGFAQFNLGFDHYDDIKVVHLTDTLRLPWSGGLNNPQFSSLDVNLDGHSDIYAYERDGEVTRLFINDGNGNFSPDMSSYHRFPKVGGHFVLLRDYDGDGRNDIFASGFNNYGIDVYRNISDSVVKFKQVAERLKYGRPGASALWFYVPGNDLPAIDDIDAMVTWISWCKVRSTSHLTYCSTLPINPRRNTAPMTASPTD